MNDVLRTTKFVADNSRFVKINMDRARDFAGNFEHGSVRHWLSAAPFNFSHFSDEDKLHFLFIFNALSFCYWGEPKWTVDFEGKSYDGAWGMIVALGRAIKEGHDILNMNYCAVLTAEGLAEILRANTVIPLFSERLKIINEIGQAAAADYGGRLAGLIEAAGGDSARLLSLIISEFPSFRDEAEYDGEKIFFSKRAQLLVSDIHQIFNGMGFGKLENIESLTACADYKLPQILRKFGILVYSTELADKIDNRAELKHNSAEEVEIRANTIWAVEYIRQSVAKRNPRIMSSEINDHLWLATQEKFPDDKPYHRARTTAY